MHKSNDIGMRPLNSFSIISFYTREMVYCEPFFATFLKWYAHVKKCSQKAVACTYSLHSISIHSDVAEIRFIFPFFHLSATSFALKSLICKRIFRNVLLSDDRMEPIRNQQWKIFFEIKYMILFRIHERDIYSWNLSHSLESLFRFCL